MIRSKTTFLKLAVVTLGIIALLLCIYWLPGYAKNVAETNPDYAYLRYPVLIFVYITAVPFYMALYQALKLLHYIESKNAFSELAVESLKHIRYCAIAIIALYVIGVIFLWFQNDLNSSITMTGAIVIFATSAVAVFAAVLQELLKNALEIKSENDLTI
ncbi:DUF2975 domain-containing protein [Paenibacillus donghaensis]|uniref:DUF2975 domain-containing protein n=1 Tax=Paenibacillus donghaensis TaxID=414771 RepID=UPI0018848C39|nr:DUF2975 domain-containing protein [Paenibacillus donghaensis]MBE9917051.1 DUF2975 domain-containing protein [Paenibacillus donghaensis]